MCRGKKTEERLPNTVTELDLRNLVQLVERKDGGLPWIQMMDQFIPGMRYQAWLREPKVTQHLFFWFCHREGG